ncbi:hypothetical protein V5799_008530 [Amblyomma americanum]|uniref:Uncharacterized protein n=1 Tax=Amblyomma americanum TaxID=6943 RepID=A0AAQ4FDS6_AMBAM
MRRTRVEEGGPVLDAEHNKIWIQPGAQRLLELGASEVRYFQEARVPLQRLQRMPSPYSLNPRRIIILRARAGTGC